MSIYIIELFRNECAMVYLGEFELYSPDGKNSMVLQPLGSEEASWLVSDLDEALGDATRWLADKVDRSIASRDALMLPACSGIARHGGRVVTIAIERSAMGVPAITASDAASLLGITRARIGQLCRAGTLESWKEGAHRMVSLRSVQERMAAQGKLPQDGTWDMP